MSKRGTLKLCGDRKCDRRGTKLPLSEFHKDASRKDGRDRHCKRCKARRKTEAWQARKDPEVARKPSVRVYSAIQKGFRTREQIESATGLDEDLIADALAELAFTRSVIRIVRIGEEREFHLAA